MIARTPERFRETGIDVQLSREVLKVNYGQRTVELRENNEIPFDIMVLATGARAIVPDIPGAGKPGIFTLKNLEDAIRIKSYLRQTKSRKAIIIGAGFIAMEMSEALQSAGIHTTIIHMGSLPANRWDPQFSRFMLEELERSGVEFVPDAETSAIEDGKDFALRAVTSQGNWEADLILFAVGVRPNVDLARAAGAKIGLTGAIAVNSFQQTSLDGIYAAGDCCESWHRISRSFVNIPLGDIANKQGRVAGRNIGGKPLAFPGVVGAQSFRLFNLEVAATGIDEKEAQSVGYDPASVLIWGNAVSSSMGQRKIGLKLVADKSSGILLGAQSVGVVGAVGRINALSVALWAGLNIDEVAYLDLAYSPPYSGAWDIIHNAAQTLRRAI
jgi:CoA-dependent NAD(P)H sulfur oxidoreductase